MATCNSCKGNGTFICKVCDGWQKITCPKCKGHGYVHLYESLTGLHLRDNSTKTCNKCQGDGSLTCKACGGAGRVHCRKCGGSGIY